MFTVGIITCQILELEFVRVLSADPDVSAVWIVEDEFADTLIRMMENENRPAVHRLTTLDGFTPAQTDPERFSLLIRVMEVGLHSNIPVLKRGVTDAVNAMASYVDAVLLGYGLCGNAFHNAGDLFGEIPVPVILPMDVDGPVDDCVGLIIGGRENYYAEQCTCAGTMFMNAGFSRHWKKIMGSDIPERLRHKKNEIMNRLMDGYRRSLLLTTPVLGEDELRRNTREFNERYGLETDVRSGTLKLLENAWAEAKRAATGSRWP